ncbi:hypothetical protein [Streptomyces sp. 8ZJF_21]|uniref:hypothetical protein n=1 Tax=Streptomyces sp. 8ZJF_21 TaxID=2903141 RepID=UPI001E5CE599|nr:hypothetical protein [Streptomyces sp. 8ZJF_21]MCD9593534.1 hypothetical protein [Streptomyces sp. 8ZJF_21]
MSYDGRVQNGFDVSDDARRAADEFTSRVAGELLLRSQLYAESRGSHRIERRDVYLASRDFELPAGPSKHVARRRVVIVAAGTGFALSVVLGVVLVLGALEQADRVAAAMGAVVGVLGLFVSIAALKGENRSISADVSGRLESESTSRANVGELIAVWVDIETMMRDDAPGDADLRHQGVSLLVRDFAQRYDLGDEFVREVRSLLGVRNRVVHGAGGVVSPDEVMNSLREAQRIAASVREIVGTSRDGS